MIYMFRGVTLRRVLETLAFGKPDATVEERRNYLRWGHVAPSAEYKLIVLLAAGLAVALIAMVALSPTGKATARIERQETSLPLPAPRVILVAPLA